MFRFAVPVGPGRTATQTGWSHRPLTEWKQRSDQEYTTGLHDAIHLSKKLHKHLGEGSRNSHCVKKGQDNWPNVNKDPEGLSCISDLNHLSTECLIQDAGTPLWVCISA